MTSLPQNSRTNQPPLVNSPQALPQSSPQKSAISPQEPLSRKQRQKAKRKLSRRGQAKELPPKLETLQEFLERRGAIENIGGGFSLIRYGRLSPSDREIVHDSLITGYKTKLGWSDSEARAVLRMGVAQQFFHHLGKFNQNGSLKEAN